MPSEPDDNLRAIAIAVGELHFQIKELEAKKKELEEELRPALVGAKPRMFGNYVMECKMMPGRKTIDKDAMKADGIDPSKYEKVGKPFSQMSIKYVETD